MSTHPVRVDSSTHIGTLYTATSKKDLLRMVEADVQGLKLELLTIEETLLGLLQEKTDILRSSRDVLPRGVSKGEAFQLLEAKHIADVAAGPETKKTTAETRKASLQIAMSEDPAYQALQERQASAETTLADLDNQIEIQKLAHRSRMALLQFHTAALELFKA